MSIPSSSQCSCSALSSSTPCARRGQTKRSCSRRFINSQKPVRSYSSSLMRSQRRLRKAYTARANGSWPIDCSTNVVRPLMLLRKSTASRCRYAPLLDGLTLCAGKLALTLEKQRQRDGNVATICSKVGQFYRDWQRRLQGRLCQAGRRAWFQD